MSYNSIRDMAQNGPLKGRITAAAAGENIANPDQWVSDRMWDFASQPNWGAQWDYAVDNYQINANPEFGARTDVISDADILAAVQAIVASP